MSRKFKVVPEHVWKTWSKLMSDNNEEEREREEGLEHDERNLLNNNAIPDDIKIKLFNTLDRALQKEKKTRKGKPVLVQPTPQEIVQDIIPKIEDPDAPSNIETPFTLPPDMARSGWRQQAIFQQLGEAGVRYNDKHEIIVNGNVIEKTNIFKIVKSLADSRAKTANGTYEMSHLIPADLISNAVRNKIRPKKPKWEPFKFT